MILQTALCYLFCAKVSVTKYEPKKETVKVEQVQSHESVERGSGEVSGRSTQSSEVSIRNVGSQSKGLPQGDIQTKICSVFKDNCQEAQKVFFCESGLRPQAVSKTNDYGIAQINLKAHYGSIKGATTAEKISNLFDPAYNISLAYQLYSRQGWHPWYSSGKCHGLA